MLNLLDDVINKVLDTDWPTSPSATPKPGFYFSVPDENWRTRVTGSEVRLNIYLYEVRENREFRRSCWDTIEIPGTGTVQPSMPPAYLDCHYLITAWSPVQEGESPPTSPIPDEHKVLSEALRILMRNPDVNPEALGITSSDPVFGKAHIYLSVAPPETPRVLNDFWSAMKLPWRPAIQLIATAPLDLLRDDKPGPVVLTLVQRYACIDTSGNPDEVILIGGWVLRASDDSPIPNATVQRVSGTAPNQKVLEEVTSDYQGRFVFNGLHGTTHTFKAKAPGSADELRTLDITTAAINDHVFRMS